MPLLPISPSLTFETWAIYFIGPFQKQGKRTRARYIITTTEYVTKWEEAKPIHSCTKEVETKFIYENIITRFECPLNLINDQGTHIINQTIETLLKEFLIDHQKTLEYHPQANGAVESFNKTLTKGLTKTCNIDKDYWDDKILVVLWEYRTTYKRKTNQTPFKLVYGQEDVVPLHFRHHTLEIDEVLKVDIGEVKNKRLFQLQKLKEDIIISLQHQEAQKQQQKARHDRNIKSKNISVGDLVLLYDSRIKGKPRKLETTWVGPYIIEDLNSNGLVRLKTLQGHVFPKVVNGAQLKRYHP